mmetsp:Transcript_21283/g.45256  ORF Transcript_21283/g.45256 Transcript_21283/m.45256 type:complete len:334 (+) Transcript_21283:694-1695(+)
MDGVANLPEHRSSKVRVVPEEGRDSGEDTPDAVVDLSADESPATLAAVFALEETLCFLAVPAVTLGAEPTPTAAAFEALPPMPLASPAAGLAAGVALLLSSICCAPCVKRWSSASFTSQEHFTSALSAALCGKPISVSLATRLAFSAWGSSAQPRRAEEATWPPPAPLLGAAARKPSREAPAAQGMPAEAPRPAMSAEASPPSRPGAALMRPGGCKASSKPGGPSSKPGGWASMPGGSEGPGKASAERSCGALAASAAGKVSTARPVDMACCLGCRRRPRIPPHRPALSAACEAYHFAPAGHSRTSGWGTIETTCLSAATPSAADSEWTDPRP